MASGISIISNFDLSSNNPIDFRMVASNSTERDSIFYKYNGLKTYVLSDNKTYTWEGTTWSVDGNGIYGGSGSLLNNINVNLGFTGDFITSSSKYLGFSTTTTDGNNVNFNIDFERFVSGTSSNDIQFTSGLYTSGMTLSYISLGDNLISFSGKMDISNSSFFLKQTPIIFGEFTYNGLSQNRRYALPDRSGTIALLSQIPTFSGLSLNTMTSYGNTSSVGIKSTLPYIGATASIYIGTPGDGSGATIRNWITYDSSGYGMYFTVQMPGPQNDQNLSLIRMSSGTNSNLQNKFTFQRVPTSIGVSMDILCSNLTSDRNITFPNNSGTVSLTTSLPTGSNRYAYYELKVDSNITLGSYVGTTTPLYPGGATATFLNLTPTTLTNNRTLEIPAPTLSNIGWTLIIRFKQPSVRSYFSTIPYYVPSTGTSQSIIPNGVTSLISDGTRWTRWAFSNGGLTTE